MDIGEVTARQEIADLLAEYTLSNDLREWDRMDRIWADDAVMLVPGVGVGRYEGRAEIMARYRGLVARQKQADSAAAEGKPAMTFSRHHLTSSRVTMQGVSRATAITYYLVITDVGYDHSGCYEDSFVRSSRSWQIAERKTLVEHVGENSYYGFLRAAAAQNARARDVAGGTIATRE